VSERSQVAEFSLIEGIAQLVSNGQGAASDFAAFEFIEIQRLRGRRGRMTRDDPSR
jgi:hypothetical protein